MSVDVLLRTALALGVVVVAGRLTARALARTGQPGVIGEVLSGILLGPSLLGLLSPSTEAFLFPGIVRPLLGVTAEAGVLLYMFLVGLEFDATLLRNPAGASTFAPSALRWTSLVFTSQASIVAPFALGCALALAMFEASAAPGTSRTAFALFMGVAMSITAFPVLARILADRGLTRSQLGVTALACAAVNDVMAWCLLAVVVGVSHAMPKSGVPGELVIAFAIGAFIPTTSRLAQAAQRWLHGPVTILLLPAFFALTGLRTEISLVSSAGDWAWCAVIILAATLGKLGGAAAAGRLAGMPWRFAAALGALMNTRGLMELIVLNVGLEAGIITPRLFTMMVIMALVTTAMAAPLLGLVVKGRGNDRQDAQERSHA